MRSVKIQKSSGKGWRHSHVETMNADASTEDGSKFDGGEVQDHLHS